LCGMQIHFWNRSFSKGHLTPQSYITPSYSRMSRPSYSRKSRRPYITPLYSRTSHCRAAENHIIRTSNHCIVESHVVRTSHHCTVGRHAVMQLKIMPLYSRMSHLLYSRKSHCRAVTLCIQGAINHQLHSPVVLAVWTKLDVPRIILSMLHLSSNRCT